MNPSFLLETLNRSRDSKFWTFRTVLHSVSTCFILKAPNFPGGYVICTNAHCVEKHCYSNIVTDSGDYEVNVISQIPEYDVAFMQFPGNVSISGDVLTYMKKQFKIWDLHEYVSPGERVDICGFPGGGKNVSWVSGVCNRYESVTYGKNISISMNMDATISGGNSGSPVLYKNKVCGMAFAHNKDVNSQSLAIPGFILAMLLATPEFPGVIPRDLFLGYYIPGSQSDIGTIHSDHYYHITESREQLISGDYICSINDVNLMNSGNLRDPRGFTCSIPEFLSLIPNSVKLNVTLIRDKKNITESWVPKRVRYDDTVAPRGKASREEQYVILGGLVFLQLVSVKTENPKKYHELKIQSHSRDQIQRNVILQDVLITPENKCYRTFRYYLVTKFNNTEIRNLEHLYELYSAGFDPRSRDTGLQFTIKKGDHVETITLPADYVYKESQRIVSSFYPGMLYSSFEIARVNEML